MFKVGRWRNEKIKVVFRLHFQAIQVPCTKSRLMISLVPVDVGQPTVRLGKAAVNDGICTWENPVYESVKFIRETKTGKLQDKFYHFIISTGSSKSGFLGEVSINFADYVEAATPFTLSLPIKSSNSGAVLHVTIQNMQGVDDQRELHKEGEEYGESNISLHSQLNNTQLEGDVYDNTLENGHYNAEVSLEEKGRINSWNGVHQELDSYKSSSNTGQNSHHKEVKENYTREHSNLDWSSEDEITTWMESNERKLPSKQMQKQEEESPKNLVEKLEMEIFALKRQAEVTDIELQSLRRQVVKETKRGQDLTVQVNRLREERDALRAKTSDVEESEQKETRAESKKQRDRVNKLEEDLVRAKDLNRSLRSKLSKAQDTNSELVLVVRDLEQKLEKRDRELADLSSRMTSDKEADGYNSEVSDRQFMYDSKEMSLLQEQIQELQCELEGREKENVKLEEQIQLLSQNLQISKKENSDLSSRFNQKQLELIKKEKECAQIQRKVEELESQVASLERVLKNQAEEFSESSDIINELEKEVNNLRNEMERQAVEFEEELNAITTSTVQHEQRAIQAEENFRKLKVENADAAQKIQEEFQKLSEELASKFKENEELTIKAEAEAEELRLHVTSLDENLRKANEELELVQDQCKTEVQKLTAQLREKEKELEKLVQGYRSESEELRSNRKKAEDKSEALSKENQALRTEVERLTEENYYFTKQLEEMKTVIDETNTALEEASRERDDIDKNYASAKLENRKLKEHQITLQSLKEKNDDAMNGVQSQLKSIQAQHVELKKQLTELKAENENLRKQIARQKESLQKKDNDIALLEKIKNSSSKEVSALKEKVKQLKAVRQVGISPENGSKAEEKKHMGRKLQNSEGSVKSLHNGVSRASGERRETFAEKKTAGSQTSDLLAELSLLKEKNKSMEDDLKEMQEKYTEVSLKFAEVEGERQQLVMTIRNLRNSQKK